MVDSDAPLPGNDGISLRPRWIVRPEGDPWNELPDLEQQRLRLAVARARLAIDKIENQIISERLAGVDVDDSFLTGEGFTRRRSAILSELPAFLLEFHKAFIAIGRTAEQSLTIVKEELEGISNSLNVGMQDYWINALDQRHLLRDIELQVERSSFISPALASTPSEDGAVSDGLTSAGGSRRRSGRPETILRESEQVSPIKAAQEEPRTSTGTEEAKPERHVLSRFLEAANSCAEPTRQQERRPICNADFVRVSGVPETDFYKWLRGQYVGPSCAAAIRDTLALDGCEFIRRALLRRTKPQSSQY